MADDLKKINSALNIMRRMPPSKIRFNLSGLLNLMPEATDELLQRVDQPLEQAKDKNGKLYLLCDYNRDGDSYRSPWNNEYEPPLPDGFMPSPRLRQIEEKMNIVFDSYRMLYYEGGISSVYLFDLDSDDGQFAACFLIKKEILEPQRRVSQGNWDSIHVVEVVPIPNQKKAACNVLLSGSLTRKSKEKQFEVNNDDDHIENMGKLVEDIEISVRGEIEGVYIQKTREVVNYIRRPPGAQFSAPQKQGDMMGELQNRFRGASMNPVKGVPLAGLNKN